MGCAKSKYADPLSPPAKKGSNDAPNLEKRPSRVTFETDAEVIAESAKPSADTTAAAQNAAHLEKTHSSDGQVVKRKNVTAMVKASDLPPPDDDEDDDEEEGAPAAVTAAAPVVPAAAQAAKKPVDPNAKVHISDESTAIRRTEVDRAIRGEEPVDGGDGELEGEKTPQDVKKRIPTQMVKLGAMPMDDDDEDEEEEDVEEGGGPKPDDHT